MTLTGAHPVGVKLPLAASLSGIARAIRRLPAGVSTILIFLAPAAENASRPAPSSSGSGLVLTASLAPGGT